MTPRTHFVTRLALAAAMVVLSVVGVGGSASAATPHPMSAGPYFESFSDIPNWTDNFASGTGANRWASVAVNATGSIPDGVKTTVSSATFQTTGTSGGVQRGNVTTTSSVNPPGTIVLLATGAPPPENGNASAIDLLLDFSTVTAGYLSFDWASVNNATGNRVASLRVYWSTNGTTFTEIPGAAVLNVVNNAPTNGNLTVRLPAAFDNASTARLRFYIHNGTGTTSESGSRPKIAIDNVVVTTAANHALIATSNWGGKITPSGMTEVANGTNQTFNITPDTGFQVRDVKVDGVSQGAIGTYTFTNVITNHFISVTFAGGPVGWWPMNQGAGTAIPDSSGNGNGATLNGGTWGSGIDGNAVSVSGGQYGVTAANPVSLNTTSELTIAAWIKPGTTGTMPVITKETVTPAGWGYALELSSVSPYKPFFRLDNNNTSGTAGSGRLDAATPYTPGQWTHLAATYDGTTMKIYVNGALSGTQTRPSSLLGNSLPVAVGAQSLGETGRFYSGAIDDARIYAYALNATEIAALLRHPLNVAIVGAGTVGRSPDQATYDHSTYVTLTATPTGGASFVGWSGDTSTTTNPLTLPMNRTRNITATFSASITHNVAVTTGAGGAVTPPGPNVTVNDGSNQTFTVTAKPGFHIKDVLVDGGSVGAVPPYTYTYTFTNVTTDRTIAASFEANPPTLVARWPMDGNLNDVSGNGFNATPAGGPGYGIGIEGSGALLLDGTSQYAFVPHNAALNVGPAVTLSAWVRPAQGTTQDVIQKGISTGTDDYELCLAMVPTGSTGTPFVRLNGAFKLNAVSLYPTDGSAWMHVATTYDGSTVKMYVNGVMESSSPYTNPIAGNTLPLVMGAQVDGVGVASRWLKGALDDARLYNYALSPTDIAALASHSLTVATVGNGTVTPTPGTYFYTHNSVASLSATPATGWSFAGWSGGATGTTSPVSVTMDGNKTVTATFVANTPTTTTLLSDLNPSIVGSIVTLTATVTPSAATGTVTFLDNGVAMATVPLSGGLGTLATADLTVGAHPLTARYEGDATHATSASAPPLDQVVNRIATSTGLTSTANPSPAAQDLVLTATVTPNTATGTVTFFDNGVLLGTGVLSDGTAILPTGIGRPLRLLPGTHPLTAHYEGDESYTSSASSPVLDQVMDKYVTYIGLWSDLNPSESNATVTLTAEVHADIGELATGTVTFLDDGVTIGTGALNGATAMAVLATSGLAVGLHPLTARYEGDATHPIVTSSPALDQVVSAPANISTVNVGTSPGMITLGNPVRTVPVSISRLGTTPLMAFSVVFSVSSPLAVNGGLSGIHEGTYLKAGAPPTRTTSFQLIDKGGGVYQADGTTLGTPCGVSDANGTLFTIDLAGGAAGGSGTVAITRLKLRDCSNLDMASVIGTSSTVSIDQSAPAVQVTLPNGGEIWHVGSSQTLTWTGGDPEGIANFDLAYSTDGGGTYPNVITTVPGTQTSYAWTIPSVPGTAVRVRATAHDENGNTGADASDANFTIAYYTLTYTAGPNGSISGTSPQTVSSGASGTAVAAVPALGYHFVNWSDASTANPRTDTNVTVDISVIANFGANPTVPAITSLTATQNRTANSAGATTDITLSWDATTNTVEVWRAAFGHYPEYDDAGGAVPTAPSAYPPGTGWVKTDAQWTGNTDRVPDRDFYYYVAYQRDSYDTWSLASTMTPGTLNYHLGDVSDGTPEGLGDNLVNTGDISLLGAHYGITAGAVAEFAYLDVGPTTSSFIDGLPTTDNRIDFEDLVMFAINHTRVSAPMPGTTPSVTSAVSAVDALTLEAPEGVAMGATATTRLMLRGSGDLVALATKLAWDPAVVEPVGHTAGEWLTRQSGVAFSSVPGTVDAAVMQSQGMTGEGELATLTFRVLSAGDPKIRIVSTDGRDARNQKVDVMSSLRPLGPAVTQLAPPKPNPFKQTATVSFSLAESGPVEVFLYSVDGRRVRTLARGIHAPGEYALVWDGRDDNGRPLSAGVYYLHLTTALGRLTRTMTYLK